MVLGWTFARSRAGKAVIASVITLFLAALLAIASGAAVRPLAMASAGELDLDDGDPSALVLEESTLIPPRDGNTMHALQPIEGVLQFASAGWEPKTVHVTVKDLTTGEESSPGVALFWASADSLRVRSEPVALAPGHRYLSKIDVTNLLGHVTSLQWHFRRIEFSVAGTTARIEGTPGVRLDEKGRWAFLPMVRLSPFTVTSGASEHSGWGPMGQVVPLGGAMVEYQSASAGTEALSGVYPEKKTVTVYKQYHKAKGEGAATVDMYGQEVWLEPLQVRLPPDATNAVLKLDPVSTHGYVPASDCVVPTETVPACTPDPLRFFVPEDFAQTLLDLPLELGLTTAQDEPVLGETPMFLTELVDPSPGELLSADPYWQAITLDQGIVDSGFEENADGTTYWYDYLRKHWGGFDCIEDPNACTQSPQGTEGPAYLEGVSYGGTLWPHTPAQFAQACAVGFPCTSAQASETETEKLRRDCLSINGEEKRHPEKQCRQFNYYPYMHAAKPVAGTSPLKHEFTTLIRSQIGYMDWWTANPNDQLGIGWRDDTGWQIGPDPYDNFKLMRYDIYYCDGREYDQPVAQQSHLVTTDQVSGYNPTVHISGSYGVAHPDAAQWKYTSSFLSATNSECHYYWPYPGAVSRVSRPAFSRATTMLVSARARTYDPQFWGTAVASVGHIHKTYAFRWGVTGLKATCSQSGCKPGIGFSFEPYERDKSYYQAYDFTYEYGF